MLGANVERSFVSSCHNHVIATPVELSSLAPGRGIGTDVLRILKAPHGLVH